MIADTSFLIDIMAKEPRALRKARDLEAEGTSVLVGSPSVFELFAGVSLSGKPEEEKSKIMAVLSSLPQLALDFPAASAGGLVYGEKERMGRRIDPEDAMIAGIARVRAEKVLSRNTKHFSGIEGVQVETY